MITLDEYLEKQADPEDEILAALTRYTYLHALNPRMISGHVQGRVLEMLSRMIKPSNILEIGTFTGYSGICLARGLAPGGTLHTIDIDDEIVLIAREFFEKAGLDKSILVHTGDAREIIPALAIKFDLVFIDGDKAHYPDYLDAVIDKMNPGGIILADNVLWDGKVLLDDPGNDPRTLGIVAFNEKVKNNTRLEKVILPLRDGLYVIRVKNY
jgi:caffeoyl-CoA O-methyltransferase